MRFQAGLPKTYWSDCVLTAAYLINKIPTPILQNKTPYEMLHHNPPTYSTLRIFGCLALAHNPNFHTDKFNPRGVPCVFIGYLTTQKGYRLLNLFTSEVFVSRDMKWFEHILSYTLSLEQLQHLIPSSLEHQIHGPPSWEDSSDDEPDEHTSPPSPTISHYSRSSSDVTTTSSSSSDSPNTIPTPQPLKRSTRTTQPPPWLKDYATSISNLTLTTDNPEFTCFLSTLTHKPEPNSYMEALHHSHWIQAMNEELQALDENMTWMVTDLPSYKGPIGCKWLFKTKYLPNGNIERYKARLVYFGKKQKYGIDYLETFAPVAKLTTIRSLLVVVALQDWEVY